MTAKLTTRQVFGIVVALLLLAVFLAYRYFTAPTSSTEEAPEDRALHGTTVVSLNLVFEEHVPQHLNAPPIEALRRPRPAPKSSDGGNGMFSGGGMSREQLKLETQREARKAKLTANAIAYLRRSGVPITADEPFHKPSPGEASLYVTIRLVNELGVYDGEPTWGNLSYRVDLERMLFASPQAKEPIRVVVQLAYPVGAPLTGFVGTVAPETLSGKQEEALGRACEAIVAHWKYDNPASRRTP